MHVEGLLKFLPVEDPGLPEPYATGTAAEKEVYERSELGKAQYANNMQKINNHTAIAAGNREASGRVDKYNGERTNYFLNGGAASGLSLPELNELDLESCYAPAVDATSEYHPPGFNGSGYWAPAPGAPATDPAPWSLPPGTVLYEVLP